MIAHLLAAACIAVSGCDAAHAKTQYSFRPVVGALDEPVYVTGAPGEPGRLYVVEQPGRIRIVENGRLMGTFLDIESQVRSGGEQGLLSVAFHPAYQQNHRFYVNYTDNNGDTRVVEFRAENRRAETGSARQLLFVDQPYANHNGGQLEFDRQGYLYVGMGDGGSAGDPGNRAQNLGSQLGKLLRRKPLVAGSAWRIVGYGLRNPWRFSFDRLNGDLWIGDVGQNAIEEIDYRPRARIGRLANYGWNRYEGRSVYSSNPLRGKGQLVFPAAQYGHGGGACSVTGGYVYRGSAVPAARGRYFYGDFCSGDVWSFRVRAGRASAVRSEPFDIPSLSSFGEDLNGELYATSLNGTLYRLRP